MSRTVFIGLFLFVVCLMIPDSARPEGSPVSEGLCDQVIDLKDHSQRQEICTLINAGIWPLDEGQSRFEPEETASQNEVLQSLLKLSGHWPLVSTYSEERCTDEPILGLALKLRIKKIYSKALVDDVSYCPDPTSRVSKARLIFQAQRAFLKSSDENYLHYFKLSRNYDGPEYDLEQGKPCGLPPQYYHYAYNTNVFAKNHDLKVCDISKAITRAEAAFIIYHTFQLDGRDESYQLPQQRVEQLLMDAQKYHQFPAYYNVHNPMYRHEFVGLAMHLMKTNACLEYSDQLPVPNPYQDFIPDDEDFPYEAEITEAARRNIIRKGESRFISRRGAAVWLYRILRDVANCVPRNCWSIKQEQEKSTDPIILSQKDQDAQNFSYQAVCAHALQATPLAKIDEGGAVTIQFAGVPEAEELLEMTYRMLQQEPQVTLAELESAQESERSASKNTDAGQTTAEANGIIETPPNITTGIEIISSNPALPPLPENELTEQDPPPPEAISEIGNPGIPGLRGAGGCTLTQPSEEVR